MASSTQGNHAEGAATSPHDSARTTTQRFFSIITSPKYLRSQRLYERKAVTELWNKLTTVAKQQWKWKNVTDKETPDMWNSRTRILQVRGPPGSGKSSATYHWVSSVCQTLRETRALWINCATDGSCWAMQLDEIDVSVKATERAVPLTADDAVGAADIVVFDGVRASSLEHWRGLMNDLARCGILVVAVSSEGVFFHQGDSQDIIKLDHFVPSWVISEYFEACHDDQFWNSSYYNFVGASQSDSFDRRKDLVNEKFETAGHSARFMFKQSVTEIIREIKGMALAMGGIDSLEAAVQSDRSAGAVNTLIARLQADKNGPTPEQHAIFPVEADFLAAATGIQDLLELDDEGDHQQTSPFLVSARATEEVVKVIPSTVERLRGVARALDNQVIEGYALEQQLKKKLNEAKQPGRQLVVRINGQDITLHVSQVIFCDSEEVLDQLRDGQNPDTWIFVAGRQGAFDAVHVVSNTHIRFVQVTAGKSHTFKLHILDSMMTALGLADGGVTWSHLEFVILRPEDDRRRFYLKKTEGSLQGYQRFDHEPWHRPDYRDNVQYATLDWD